MKLAGQILKFGVLVLLLTFSFSNQQALTLSFWPLAWSATLPASVGLLAAFFLGGVSMFVVLHLRRLPQRRLRPRSERPQDSQDTSASPPRA